MSGIRMQIDGKEITATQGTTILEAARGAGIEIPTLCYLDGLEPFGGCRLCIVELDWGNWKRPVVACERSWTFGTPRPRTPEAGGVEAWHPHQITCSVRSRLSLARA